MLIIEEEIRLFVCFILFGRDNNFLFGYICSCVKTQVTNIHEYDDILIYYYLHFIFAITTLDYLLTIDNNIIDTRISFYV